MPLPAYTPGCVVDPSAIIDTSTIQGKSVIVTGGASGIGEAYTRKFAAAGAFVTIGDLNEKRGSELATELGSTVRFVRCDVVEWDDQVRLFKTAVGQSPNKSCDIVVANAGVMPPDQVGVLDESEEPVKPTLKINQVNSVGVLYTTKLALHYFNRQPETAQHDRCLILISSGAAYMDLSGTLEYAASKWSVRGIMTTLRRTSWQKGVRVNSIAPWYIATAMIPKEVIEHLSSIGVEFATPEDAAAAVMHVAVDKSINGRAIGILPRSVAANGYRDLEHDDYKEDDFMCGWQETVTKTSEAMAASPLQV